MRDVDVVVTSANPRIGGAGTRYARLWLALLLMSVAVALTLTMAGPVLAIGRHVSFSPNEGWNAYWAERALGGRPLYTNASSPITNNYTPLSFFIVGIVGRWAGDFIVAGRVICLVSLLGCIVLVGCIVVALGGSRRWGIFAAICLLLFVAAAAPARVAVDDPHWLSELPMLAALLVLVHQTRLSPTALQIFSACALMLLSGLIKQSGVALPIAVTIWLSVIDRRALLIWLLSAAFGGSAALIYLHTFGPTTITEIVLHDRVLHLRLIVSAAKTLSPLVPAMIAMVALLRGGSHVGGSRPVLLVALFTGTGLVLGILERLGTGTAQNVHFDTAIGLFILLGVGLSRYDSGRRFLDASEAQILALVLVIASLIGTAIVHEAGTIGRIADQPAAERRWAEGIAIIHHTPGMVACEQLALCYWAGKPFVLDFSNYGQKLRRGDPAGLAAMIRRKEFAVIVSVRDKRYSAYNSRLPIFYDQLIEANYRVLGILPDNIYLSVPDKP